MSAHQDSAVEAVARELLAQMEAQADDTAPSSLHRQEGRIWLEGWFDLAAAMPTDTLREQRDELLAALVWLRAWWKPGSKHDTDEVKRGLDAADAAIAKAKARS